LPQTHGGKLSKSSGEDSMMLDTTKINIMQEGKQSCVRHLPNVCMKFLVKVQMTTSLNTTFFVLFVLSLSLVIHFNEERWQAQAMQHIIGHV
jgi:hypothetical protein